MAEQPRPSDQEIASRVKRLQQQFGRHLDTAVLEAVLEMHNFNYNEAQGFLQAENQDAGVDLTHFNPANQQQQEDAALPPGYFDQPQGFQAPAAEVEDVVMGGAEELRDLKELFVKQSTFQDHYVAQRDRLVPYLATFMALVRSGMEVKDASKARTLAALWSHKKFSIADYLLSPQSNKGAGFGFGLTEVLKAVNLLDSGRKVRVLEKRLNLLQKRPKIRQRTLGKITSSINDLKREPVQGSLSGALSRHVRRWVQSISKSELQFFSIHLPKEPWKELADLLHLNPQKDLAEPWFLPVAFGENPPADSIVAACSNLTPETILQVVQEHSPPYTFLRKSKEVLTPEALAHVATYTPLETLVWWYEEMRSETADRIIQEKFQAGETLKMGYGKLMERLLTFKAMDAPFLAAMIPAAEHKLQSIRLPLQPPVVCFGDASYSMDVAIRVSTIIASLMTAITNADLRFFNTESIVPPKVPRTIEDVLELTMTIKADKLTAPAAPLQEYYRNKIPVNTFIIVTDEVENIPHDGDYFAQLFYKYRQEVHAAAQLVFVSFLPSQNVKGRMVRALEQLGIKPLLEVRLDGARPDLTKLDSMLAALASQTEVFRTQTDDLAQRLSGPDLNEALGALEAS